MMGICFTAVTLKGKLYAETLEGSILVKADEAVLEVLDPTGEVIGEIRGEKERDGIRFAMTGEHASVQYHLIIKK